ncbi:MAG TPA: response regulator [bacterium]|nr:response regulator [bacterium]
MNKKAKLTRVLIVEDDRDTNELVALIMKDAGFETVSALDGREGLDKARDDEPDIIILDLMLPEIDGLEVCRRLSADEKTKSIPIIILTAKRELSTKLSSFVAGAKRFVTKPFDSNDLLIEINRTLRQKELQANDVRSSIEPRD